MRTYKVYYIFFKVRRSMDISANSPEEAKKILSNEYGIDTKHILSAIDYKEINQQQQNKFGRLRK